MKHEILIFENQTWDEIPEQDNPGFHKTTLYECGQPEWFAILICKVLPSESSVTGPSGYIVTDVSSNVPDVVRLGVFWNLDNAKIFAEAYAKAKC